jgi:hypothetical protein
MSAATKKIGSAEKSFKGMRKKFLAAWRQWSQPTAEQPLISSRAPAARWYPGYTCWI